MTDKEIKDKLKKANEEYVIKETEVDIVDNFEVNKMKQYRKTYAKIFIPSSVAITAAAVLAIVLPITLVPGNLPGDDVTDPSLIGISLTADKINKLAFETTTAVQSAVTINNVPKLSIMKAFSDTEKSQIESTLSSIDLILTNKSTFKTTLVESTNKDYSYEIIVSYLGINDQQFEYSMFFNILKDKTYSDEDETTRIVKYSGIMNLDMAGYEFVATLEEEQEGHESENEISTTVYLNASKTSYVQVEQSSENDTKVKEESFEYEVWDRGVLVKNFEIETEISGSRSDIETEINNNSYKVELLDEQGKTIFKFSKEKDLNDSIRFEKVKSIDSQTGNIIVSYLEVL